MKLPRYLQISLLATVVAVAWSQLTDEEPAGMMTPIEQSAPVRLAKPRDSLATPAAPSRTNLFPQPTVNAFAEKPEPAQDVEPEQPTPDLPFKALGTWWSQNQRVILLTNGVDTWPVCTQCKAEEKIWIGSEPVSGWQLKAVEKDHLLFEWLLTHAQRKLELGELQSEPTQ